ncbi:serpin B8-like [Anthonomus grandis grandis]|uniref:serpin B8-like n=1 Tax=Anthonomus grandis grandis TaxID=2921223 RepID=UPI002165A9B1|nr:serpin B8-like [Anthonomus grandis grandis]
MGLLLLLRLLLTIITPNLVSTALRDLLQGNSDFTQKLQSVLAADAKPQENIFLSPISANAVLSLNYQGARGASSAEFAQVLNIKVQANAANGQSDQQQNAKIGEIKNKDTADKALAVVGQDCCVGYDGRLYTVENSPCTTADENGCQPTGEYIPPAADISRKIGYPPDTLASLN